MWAETTTKISPLPPAAQPFPLPGKMQQSHMVVFVLRLWSLSPSSRVSWRLGSRTGVGNPRMWGELMRTKIYFWRGKHIDWTSEGHQWAAGQKASEQAGREAGWLCPLDGQVREWGDGGRERGCSASTGESRLKKRGPFSASTSQPCFHCRRVPNSASRESADSVPWGWRRAWATTFPTWCCSLGTKLRVASGRNHYS